MSRFSIREHFGEFASRYDLEALKAGPGLREISERELATVERRVGVVQGRRVLDAGVGPAGSPGCWCDAARRSSAST